MADRSKWCIVGIADDQGVLHVGGRVGAARGPAAFLAAFRRFRGNDDVSERLGDVIDVEGLGTEVDKNLHRAGSTIAQAAKEHAFCVVVGGGNDHAYSQLLGHSDAQRLGCINIDAHFDVRPPATQITSGSPFYIAIERKRLDPRRFIEFGIQSHCNAPALWRYIREKGVAVVEFGRLRENRAAREFTAQLKALARRCDEIAICLDLDALAEAYAPGVSAPQAEGFSSRDLMQMMEIAGREPKVRSLGIYELNPAHDIDGRTARLAATAAYRFAAEALRRKPGKRGAPGS